MGRALKIQKNNVGAGTTVNGNVTAYNQTVLTDAGFPNFGSLTNPAFNTPVQTLDNAQFLGVVGGAPAISSPSTTFPEILAKVNISLADGSSTGVDNGRIVRQKGSHKFLVTTATTVNDGSFIVGQAYFIIALGTTNWQAAGAGADAAVGDTFTATSVGGAGSGTVVPIGVCVLSNTASPAAGFMSISYSVGDSSAVFASYITNKWVRDWNGMTYGNYSDSNFGVNIQSGENQYVTNFFTDEGNVTVSGGELSGTTSVDNPTIQLAQIASVTS
jgi:hypothetical protein